MDVRSQASAEREDFAAFLRTLGPNEWEQPSLCKGWRVRDVVAHVIQIDHLKLSQIIGRLVRARFSADAFNAAGVASCADWTTERLVSTLEAQAELGRLSRIQGGRPALLDALIHHQDCRRPLGRLREVPVDRLRVSLDHPDPFAGASRRRKGLRLVATDVEWAAGEGPEVRGPGEAIVMATSGRAAALDQLDGKGVALLAERI